MGKRTELALASGGREFTIGDKTVVLHASFGALRRQCRKHNLAMDDYLKKSSTLHSMPIPSTSLSVTIVDFQVADNDNETVTSDDLDDLTFLGRDKPVRRSCGTDRCHA